MRSIFLMSLLTVSFAAGETKIPNPLAKADGTLIDSSEAWEKTLRPATLELFREHIYGISPTKPVAQKITVIREDPSALQGTAISKEIEIEVTGPKGSMKFKATLFLPKSATQPVPAFIFLCNRSHQLLDPANPNEFWPVREIVSRGFATAAFQVSDVDPDDKSKGAKGVRELFNDEPVSPNAWGTIAAWSWGASRVLDHLVTEKAIDSEKIGVVGHSRGGKAALWAGAEDERFALVISNNSGCTGAAMSRTTRGEKIADINKNFPHWFCENYKKFDGAEEKLPADQHQLIALIAPRLAYVASAADDKWADPEAEFASCQLAKPVYQLFGQTGLEDETFPDVETAYHKGQIGYHLRAGKHDLKLVDWNRFMNFAESHWRK